MSDEPKEMSSEPKAASSIPMEKQRCGFVAILGAPNAGKSTLVNAMAGTKVTIVSPKPQTTRFRVRAVLIEKEAQIVLVDTPGIFAPRRRLDRAMVSAAWGGAKDADFSLLVVDVKSGLTEAVRTIIERLVEQKRTVWLALNHAGPTGQVLAWQSP